MGIKFNKYLINIMKNKIILRPVLLVTALISFGISYAQEDNALHLTTGIGFNSIQGNLNKTFRSSVAFNSGFEKSFSNNWYGQVELNFNSLKYDQQVKDQNSPYLFQNTSSSFFQAGVNWGYNFHFRKTPVFTSVYTGTGFHSIGKPRISLDEQTNIATQSIVRGNGIFGKAGVRSGVNTKSRILHTIYLDGSWLTSTVKTEGSRFKNIAVFIGMRMAMTAESKTTKKQMKALKILR
jgi:hypothetical protein